MTGEPFSELLKERILDHLDLDHTFHARPMAGEPNHGTAGVITTIPDLLRWGAAFFLESDVMTAESRNTVLHVTDPSGFGEGSFGWCPCEKRDDGTVSFRYVVYSSGYVLLVYSKADAMIAAITVHTNIFLDDNLAAVRILLEALSSYTRDS